MNRPAPKQYLHINIEMEIALQFKDIAKMHHMKQGEFMLALLQRWNAEPITVGEEGIEAPKPKAKKKKKKKVKKKKKPEPVAEEEVFDDEDEYDDDDEFDMEEEDTPKKKGFGQ